MIPLLALSFSLLGMLVIKYQPENRIGWLFVVGGTAMLLGFVADGYHQCALRGTRELPGAAYSGWIGALGFLSGVPLFFVYLPFWFPDGQYISSFYRRLGNAVFISFAVMILLVAVWPGPMDFLALEGELVSENPFGLNIGPPDWLDRLLRSLVISAQTIFALTAMLSLIQRWHRSSGETRQQLKWFAYFLATAGLLFIGVEIIGEAFYPAIFDGWFYLVELAAFWLGYPVVMAVVIFKYRLYDIDLIIRRTLVYAAVTGMLALVYFGSVTFLQSGLAAATGQRSPAAIVVSTLLIAALFTPLRQRIQKVIDRRFYRQKYDAAQTLASFAQISRDEVNLDELTAELHRVVENTVQPSTILLWLREREEGDRL
jgi:hypothetical protein